MNSSPSVASWETRLLLLLLELISKTSSGTSENEIGSSSAEILQLEEAGSSPLGPLGSVPAVNWPLCFENLMNYV